MRLVCIGAYALFDRLTRAYSISPAREETVSVATDPSIRTIIHEIQHAHPNAGQTELRELLARRMRENEQTLQVAAAYAVMAALDGQQDSAGRRWAARQSTPRSIRKTTTFERATAEAVTNRIARMYLETAKARGPVRPSPLARRTD
jgi:hypothetical protein